MQLKSRSVITCPHCAGKKEAEMPRESCQFFYRCDSCEKTLRPKEGDCCVFCSYGTVPCPSKQTEDNAS